MTRKPTLAADLSDILATPSSAAMPGRGPELPQPVPKPEGGIKAATVGTTLYLLPDESKRLKMFALTHDRSLHDLILDGLDRILLDAGEPPLRRYSR